MVASAGIQADERPGGGPPPPPGGPPPLRSNGAPPTDATPPRVELDLDAPVRSISVRVQGLRNVRPETIAPEIRGFDGVHTVRDLLLAVRASQERLSDLHLFSVLASQLNCGGEDGGVTVTYRLKELNRRCNFGVNINGRGQAEVEAAADIPALAGSNKCLQLSVATAPSAWEGGASRSASATLGLPRLPAFAQRGGSFFSRGLLRLCCSTRDMCAYTSTTASTTGASAELLSRDGAHALVVGWTFRDTTPVCAATRVASTAVMSMPWRSLKHSLRYMYTRTRLDQQQQAAAAPLLDASAAEEREQTPVLLPRRGYAVQTAAEAALPGGDARFLKAELHAFAATPLRLRFLTNYKREEDDDNANKNSRHSSSKSSGSDDSESESPWVLTGRVGVGALVAPQSAWPVCLEDKFYFGKMSSPLRGFKSYAVGPSARAHVLSRDRSISMPVHDYLGGDAYFASELCLAYDFHLPQTVTASARGSSSNGLRGFAGYHPRCFVFGSVGALSDVFQAPLQQQQQQQRRERRFSALFKEWRCSMGFGVCFPLARGIWAELALALPLRRAETDQIERFQVGFKVASVDLGQ
ncbi:hypothetical protein Esti_005469 [Eimeria stiedai]